MKKQGRVAVMIETAMKMLLPEIVFVQFQQHFVFIDINLLAVLVGNIICLSVIIIMCLSSSISDLTYSYVITYGGV
jgi:hypothetical protein